MREEGVLDLFSCRAEALVGGLPDSWEATHLFSSGRFDSLVGLSWVLVDLLLVAFESLLQLSLAVCGCDRFAVRLDGLEACSEVCSYFYAVDGWCCALSVEPLCCIASPPHARSPGPRGFSLSLKHRRATALVCRLGRKR